MPNSNRLLNAREVMAARKQARDSFKQNHTPNTRLREQNQDFNDKLVSFRAKNPDFNVSINGEIITMFKPTGEMAVVYNTSNGLMNINCEHFKAHMNN